MTGADLFKMAKVEKSCCIIAFA